MFFRPDVAGVADACEKMMADQEDAWNVDRPSALLLYQLALLKRARVIYEVGASYGFSGLFLADAAARNGGRFWTVEADARKVQIVSAQFERAGLADVVTVVAGQAPAALAGAPEGIDYLFLDADKHNQEAYLELLWPKLTPDALIVTDDVSTLGGEMEGLLKRLRTEPRFISSTVPLGDGVEVTLRVG